MIFNRIARFITFLGCCLLFAFCDSDDEKKNTPDVSNVVTNTQFKRFDQDLFRVQNEMDLDVLNKEYGKISELFFKDIIGVKKPEEGVPQYFPLLQKFLTDTFVRNTYDTTQLVFKNFEPYKKELTQAAKFYKHYFPNSELTFVTFVSQYNYDVFPFGRDTIGIGLDGFLGSNHPDYFQIENLSYEYVRRTMAPQYLSTKAMRMVIAAQAGSEMGNRLIDMMIHNGKQLYILDQLLPETPDSIKFGYSAKQTQWCKDNEVEMWASLLKANLLYETNGKKIAKLVSPSPSSPGMPPESPGETGNYLGWQIVKQFMKRNPNTTLSQLLAMRNAQEILDKGKYKPRR
jgi:predicted 3-demethylubiquinone-9 3-methyltransferase (glyoxalase superfamily)